MQQPQFTKRPSQQSTTTTSSTSTTTPSTHSPQSTYFTNHRLEHRLYLDTYKQKTDFLKILYYAYYKWKYYKQYKSVYLLNTALALLEFIINNYKSSLLLRIFENKRYEIKQRINFRLKNIRSGIRYQRKYSMTGIAKQIKEKADNSEITDYVVHEPLYITFKDVWGLEYAKNVMRKCVVDPIQSWIQCKEYGKSTPYLVPQKVLLYGPPASGKTFLASACSIYATLRIFYLSSNDLDANHLDYSKRIIESLFTMANDHIPSIILLDQLDRIFLINPYYNQRSIMALLYHRVEFAKLGVWIIATTQTPWLLHGNLINLFTTKLYIAFPSVAERYSYTLFRFTYFDKTLYTSDNSLTRKQINYLAEKTEHYPVMGLKMVTEEVKKRYRLLWVVEEGVILNRLSFRDNLCVVSPISLYNSGKMNILSNTYTNGKSYTTRINFDMILQDISTQADSEKIHSYYYFSIKYP